MTAVTKQQYNHLKNNILLNAQNYSHNLNHVMNLKHIYEDKINSTRRYVEIRDIAALVEILEIRDCVSENDITLLEEIAGETRNYTFLNYFNTLRNPSDTNQQNQNSNVTNGPVENSDVRNGPIIDVKSRVYDNIATKMGNKWTEFARELNVIESKIDEWKSRYGFDYELCTRQVLQFHERNVHPREWKSRLLEALEKARRNDLKRETNKIFVDFSETSYPTLVNIQNVI